MQIFKPIAQETKMCHFSTVFARNIFGCNYVDAFYSDTNVFGFV